MNGSPIAIPGVKTSTAPELHAQLDAPVSPLILDIQGVLS